MTQEENRNKKNDDKPKKMWVNDVVIMLLLVSAVYFLYQYNSQTEKIELEMQKNRAERSQEGPKANGKK